MKVKLETFLREITEKTTINNQYPVLTSSKSGLYLQSDYFNKQVASKDNTGYKIIRKGQFTYRAMSDTGEFFPNMLECAEIGIVSPAYPVFEIVDTSLIVPEYLKYFFKSDVFQYSIASFVQGSTRTSVKFGKLKTISMELPDKEKQNQIIEILNATERIIERRKEELQQLDELVKARFVELFGDIKVNNLNIKTAPMTELCEIIDGDRGKNYPKQEDFFEEGFDELVERIKDAAGATASTVATRQAENFLVSSCIIIPLYEQSVYYGLGKGVKGVIFNNTGEILYFKNTVVK